MCKSWLSSNCRKQIPLRLNRRDKEVGQPTQSWLGPLRSGCILPAGWPTCPASWCHWESNSRRRKEKEGYLLAVSLQHPLLAEPNISVAGTGWLCVQLQCHHTGRREFGTERQLLPGPSFQNLKWFLEFPYQNILMALKIKKKMFLTFYFGIILDLKVAKC